MNPTIGSAVSSDNSAKTGAILTTTETGTSDRSARVRGGNGSLMRILPIALWDEDAGMLAVLIGGYVVYAALANSAYLHR